MSWLIRYIRYWSEQLDRLEAMIECARNAKARAALPEDKKD